MNVSAIGIQQITPQSGTGWQGSNPPPDRGSDSDTTAPQPTTPGPPAPGTGQIVDKIA